MSLSNLIYTIIPIQVFLQNTCFLYLILVPYHEDIVIAPDVYLMNN